MKTVCTDGIRVSELSAIAIEAIRMRRADINCKGKMRVVILPKMLCKILSEYARVQNPVFITRTGKTLDRSTIWKMMKALCEDTGVSRDKVFPHNLRCLFARTYYSIQKDIVRLADILDHSSVNTTCVYTMVSGGVYCRQIQKLGLLRL